MGAGTCWTGTTPTTCLTAPVARCSLPGRTGCATGGGRTHGGAPQQLPLDDVRGSHAIHGLVRWSTWHAEQSAAHRVVLRHRLQGRPGYPFCLDLRVAYVLHEHDGLTVELTAENVGSREAPVALGMHPYLAAPDGGRVDDCRLRVPGQTRLLVSRVRPSRSRAPRTTCAPAHVSPAWSWTTPTRTCARTRTARCACSWRRPTARRRSCGRRGERAAGVHRRHAGPRAARQGRRGGAVDRPCRRSAHGNGAGPAAAWRVALPALGRA